MDNIQILQYRDNTFHPIRDDLGRSIVNRALSMINFITIWGKDLSFEKE